MRAVPLKSNEDIIIRYSALCCEFACSPVASNSFSFSRLSKLTQSTSASACKAEDKNTLNVLVVSHLHSLSTQSLQCHVRYAESALRNAFPDSDPIAITARHSLLAQQHGMGMGKGDIASGINNKSYLAFFSSLPENHVSKSQTKSQSRVSCRCISFPLLFSRFSVDLIRSSRNVSARDPHSSPFSIDQAKQCKTRVSSPSSSHSFSVSRCGCQTRIASRPLIPKTSALQLSFFIVYAFLTCLPIQSPVSSTFRKRTATTATKSRLRETHSMAKRTKLSTRLS